MPPSIRSRLMLTYTLIIAFVLVIVMAIIGLYLVRNPFADRQAWQRLQALSAVLQGIENLESITPQMRARLIERTSQAFGTRIAVFGAQGELLYDSRETGSADLPALGTLLARLRDDSPTWFRDREGVVWLYDIQTLPSGLSIVLAAPRQRLPLLVILRDEFLRPFVWAALTALSLALILAIWMSRWVAAPLQRLAQSAKAVASGIYQPIPLEGPREIQQFGRAFNEMVTQVQATQRSQREFVANVSHELKTPLTSIRGFAQALLDGTAGSMERARDAAQIIYNEAERMNRLVRDLLDLAGLDARTMDFRSEELNLADLLRATAKKFSPLAEECGVEIRLELPECINIHGDADRLSQVFDNLVDNAIKFTRVEKPVIISSEQTGEWVKVRIEDSGPGIPVEDRERIFERFYRIDKSRKSGKHGAGLGLAIAREIVAAHGGEIYLEDSSAQGSIFVVKLPLV